MDWLPEGTFDRGAVGGLLAAMAFFALVCLRRAASHIVHKGPRAYLLSAVRIERDSLGLLLILVATMTAALLVIRR